MARFSVLIFALALLLSSADGWAIDKKGGFSTHDNRSCGYYLDAYSKATLIGDRNHNRRFRSLASFGWIDGYLSAYNELTNNGKKSILGGMTINDAERWMAAWCRDNPSKDVWNAVSTLTIKL